MQWGDLRKYALRMAIETETHPDAVVPLASQFLDFLVGNDAGTNSDFPS